MDRTLNIVVPINGSEDDAAALRLACSEAKKGKTFITVVHVVEVPRSLPLDGMLPEAMAEGARVLDGAEGQMQHLGCRVKVQLLQARTAGVALLDEANRLKADLIILGLPYRSRFGSYQLGSTSNYILNHATCRVWLVRGQNAPVTETTA
jgi:nucleotide-binding universal stress UspA family protein